LLAAAAPALSQYAIACAGQFASVVVMGQQLRLRARHLGKAILQKLCHLLVILLEQQQTM
jgi:hypothetical protein